MLLNYTL
jgi:hypothetical protein